MRKVNMEINMAILMADLTGYSAMTEVHGGSSAATIVNRYIELVQMALVGKAKLHQRIGDQVVIVSEDANDLAVTAHQLLQLTLKENNFLTIHAGIHFGPILIQDEHLFGSTINVASRIMNMAGRGQILCSMDFVKKISLHGMSFQALGIHKFKNITREFEIAELRTAKDIETGLAVDPVCHMVVNAGATKFFFDHLGETYHFCSQNCLEIFKSNPSGNTR